jgi:non-specific serine/threonine protein kinase
MVRESGAGRIRHLPDGHAIGLPSPTNALIDRADEMETVRDALLGDEIRLITLAGTAGIGKTRLAVEIARELASCFPDAVWFIDLSNVSDLNSIPSAILDVFGMRGVPAFSALDRLHEYLGERHLLLILDNFEHIGAGAGVLSDLLASHANLRILVTSRHPLRLKWENTLTLHPLHVPDRGELQSLEGVSAASAVQLFVQSAQAVRLDFHLTPENVGDVVAICTYLEGIPLAIELAAGWTTLLPPSTIRKYLSSDPSFLHSRTRDVPARQQSLVAALDWSYDLLDSQEQALLRRLSVFVGGFTLDAAMAVAPDVVPDLLDGLASLVDRSLLQLQPEDDAALERHFYLLETIRTYALIRLEEHGEREEAQRSHALYYVSLAEREQAKVRHAGYFIASTTLPLPEDSTSQPESTFSCLDREYANLRAAFSWTEGAGEPEMELNLAIALSTYWWTRALLEEGTCWLEDALRRNPDAPPAQRTRALSGAGMLLRQQGKFEQAQSLLEEALSLARTVGDSFLLGGTLLNLATVRVGVDESQLDAAVALVQEALTVAQESGDVWGVALARVYLAFGELFRLEGGSAEGHLTEALSSLEELGDSRSAAVVWLLLAVAASLQGDATRAVSALAEGVGSASTLDDPNVIASCADTAAWLIRGDAPLRAAILVGASDAIRETGFARTPYERHLHMQVKDDLELRLREPELESARKQGRELTLEHVLELLEDEDALAPVPDLDGMSEADLQLSDREVEILRLMSEGMSNKQIADTIFVSEGTAKLDIRSIYRKLGAHNRAQAIGIAAERGLIRESPAQSV